MPDMPRQQGDEPPKPVSERRQNFEKSKAKPPPRDSRGDSKRPKTADEGQDVMSDDNKENNPNHPGNAGGSSSRPPGLAHPEVPPTQVTYDGIQHLLNQQLIALKGEMQPMKDDIKEHGTQLGAIQQQLREQQSRIEKLEATGARAPAAPPGDDEPTDCFVYRDRTLDLRSMHRFQMIAGGWKSVAQRETLLAKIKRELSDAAIDLKEDPKQLPKLLIFTFDSEIDRDRAVEKTIDTATDDMYISRSKTPTRMQHNKLLRSIAAAVSEVLALPAESVEIDFSKSLVKFQGAVFARLRVEHRALAWSWNLEDISKHSEKNQVDLQQALTKRTHALLSNPNARKEFAWE